MAITLDSTPYVGMIGLLGKPVYLNKRRTYGIDSVTEQHTTKFNDTPETAVEAEACVILRLNPAGGPPSLSISLPAPL